MALYGLDDSTQRFVRQFEAGTNLADWRMNERFISDELIRRSCCADLRCSFEKVKKCAEAARRQN